MRSRSASLFSDPEYVNSFKPDDADLEQWVERLRAGDRTYRDAIIKGHLRLARAIGETFGKGVRDDDCIGEAFLALTQAVEWSGPHVDDEGTEQPSRLHDNNITPYICKTIRSALSDFVAIDRNVPMPGRTFRAKAARGEIHADGNDDVQVIGVVSVMRLVMSDGVDHNEASDDGQVNHDRHLPYNVPEAKAEEPSPEFTDALTLAIHTETERRIIDLKAQDYNLTEIGGIVGLKKTQVGHYVSVVKDRFNRLYG